MHTIFAAPSRRALCAACARKTHVNSSLASRAASATRASSTYKTASTWIPPHLVARTQVRRCLSTSTAARAAENNPTTPPLPSSGQPTSHAPLPYYALFPRTLPNGAPPTAPFNIDTRALHREFLQLQAASHPDFHQHATSTPRARRQAEAVSSHINTAYTTLANPLLRAQYLLSTRYGVDLAGDEAAEKSGPADPEVLMVVLEARESIEEAQREEDLEEVRGENETRIEECLEALERAFKEEDVDAAVRETVRLRYWVNIRESVDNWEEGKPVVLQH